MNDKAIEQEIQAKGLTGPRVTLDAIEGQIHSEHCFTAWDGVAGAAVRKAHAEGRDEVDVLAPDALGLLTFCVLVMQNGFTIVGKSACASPENFNAELGRKIAREDALNQAWPLLGYELRTKLMEAQDA